MIYWLQLNPRASAPGYLSCVPSPKGTLAAHHWSSVCFSLQCEGSRLVVLGAGQATTLQVFVHLDKHHSHKDWANLSKQRPSLCQWKSGIHILEFLPGANCSTARQKLGHLLQKHSSSPKPILKLFPLSPKVLIPKATELLLLNKLIQ